MANINSAIGKTSISTNQSPQMFEIPDLDQNVETEDNLFKSVPKNAVKLTSEQFNELQERKQQIISEQRKISPETKARIEALVGIGRLEQDIKLGEYAFTLQTLKAKEMKEVVKCVGFKDGTDQIYEQRTQTLARALIKINNYEVKMVLGSDRIEDVSAFIEELEELVVAQLFDKYVEMTQMKKKTLMSPEILMEDLKK